MSDEAIFSSVLAPAERLLWTGRPDLAGVPRIWNNLKWYFTIFILASGALKMRSPQDARGYMILAPAAGVVVFHGLDTYSRRKLRRSAYAITTRRFLCAEGPPYRFRALPLDQIAVSFYPSDDGELGSIRFQSQGSSWIRLGHPDDLPWIGPLVCGVPDITPLIRRAMAEQRATVALPAK